MKIKRSYNDTIVEFICGGGIGFIVSGLLTGGGGIALLLLQSEKDFVINNQRDIIVARQVAETGAKYLKLDLIDKTGSVTTSRNHADIDLSIREVAAQNATLSVKCQPHFVSSARYPTSSYV